MITPIGVTGSTGILGGLVAEELSASGLPLNLLVRAPERAPILPRSRVLPMEYADFARSTEALRGVDTLFMVSASEERDRRDVHANFVEAARSAGVRRIVYTSFVGASPTATFTLARDHFHTEQMIRESGMDFTFLRDGLYLDALESLADEEGVIRGPAGEGRAAMVAREDIARCAVRVLLEPAAHSGRTYELTGPEAITLAEAARVITEVTGRAMSFVPETIDEAYESRTKWTREQWLLDAWVSTYTAIAAGEFAGISGDVQLLTDRPPLGLRDLLAGR